MNQNDELKSTLAALYHGGLTLRECAERCNLNLEATKKHLKEAKVKWRDKYITDLTPEEVITILYQFDQHIPVEEIAKNFELSCPSLSRLLRVYRKDPELKGRKFDLLNPTPINAIQKQFLVGTLLGDGCLHRNSAKNFSLSFSHKKAHEQYFHWKIAMSDPFINTWRENVDKRGNSIMLQTCTIAHPELNQFGEMFYNEKRHKIIPKNLDIYLTPLALAVWIMDDGSLHSSGVNMRICSQGFTEEENYQLRDYLCQCFDLRSKVMPYNYKGKKYWHLVLNKENTHKLSKIILPYMVDCMKYKLMPGILNDEHVGHSQIRIENDDTV